MLMRMIDIAIASFATLARPKRVMRSGKRYLKAPGTRLSSIKAPSTSMPRSWKRKWKFRMTKASAAHAAGTPTDEPEKEKHSKREKLHYLWQY